MDCPGQELFADSRLPSDQERFVAGTDRFSHPQHVAGSFVARYEVREHLRILQACGEKTLLQGAEVSRLPVIVERPVHSGSEPKRLAALHQVVECAFPHEPHHGLQVVLRRHDKDRGLRPPFPDSLEDGLPRKIREAQVEKNHPERPPSCAVEGLLAGSGCINVRPSVMKEKVFRHFQDIPVIVDNEKANITCVRRVPSPFPRSKLLLLRKSGKLVL